MGESMSMAPIGDKGGHICTRGGCGVDIGHPDKQDEHNLNHHLLRGAKNVFDMIDQSTADDSDL